MIDTIPERNGKTRSFLSAMRMPQLVLKSSMLLPILSNIAFTLTIVRDEGCEIAAVPAWYRRITTRMSRGC
jgi:hypothetical protein